MEVCLGPYFYVIPQGQGDKIIITTLIRFGRGEITLNIKTIGSKLIKTNEEGIRCTYQTAVVSQSVFENYIRKKPGIELILEEIQDTADTTNEKLKNLINIHKRRKKQVFDPEGYKHTYKIYAQKAGSSVKQEVADVFIKEGKDNEGKNKIFAIITPTQIDNGEPTEHWNTELKYTAGAAALLQAVFDNINNEECLGKQLPDLSTNPEAIILEALFDNELVIVYYMTNPDSNHRKNIFACSIS